MAKQAEGILREIMAGRHQTIAGRLKAEELGHQLKEQDERLSGHYERVQGAQLADAQAAHAALQKQVLKNDF